MSRTTITNRTILALATLATLAIAAPSKAQSPENYSAPTGEFYQPVSPNPVELGFTQHHASTAAEGFLRGKSAVIQAWGNFALSTSQAAILRQQARSLDRENDLQQTAALLTQKQMWEDARIQARHDHNARHAAGLLVAAQRGATVYRQAYELSPADLDAKTGAIAWPAALTTEKSEPHRTQVNELFREHFAYGDPQAATAGRIAVAIDRWSQAMRRDIRSMPRDEYMVAQKFLMGLKYSVAKSPASVVEPQPNVANVAMVTK